ncbi:MAG: dehydrogenase [Acidobacteriota bacterium]
MRVLVLLPASEESEAGVMPSEQLMTEMGQFNEELLQAGIMLAAEGLLPSSKGRRIVFGPEPEKVIDGPFTESKELIAGYWIWKVKDLDEATAWAKRIPNPDGESYTLELRPIGEFEDLGDAVTPEMRAQEARQRERAEALAQGRK